MNKGVEETTTEEWRKLLSGTRLGIQRMKNKGLGASIINMPSIEGFVGDRSLSTYNASTGAMRIMSKSAALDCALKDYDVRINTVHPGYVKTLLVDDIPVPKQPCLPVPRHQ